MWMRAIGKNNQEFHTFNLKNSDKTARLKLVKSVATINKQAARTVLVESFIGEYEKYLKPQDVDASLTSWREGENSVQRYYEKYFDVEFTKFTHGEFEFWVEAYINDELVGWATFEREKREIPAVYMDLLIVAPAQQGKGIGRELVQSLLTLKVIPDLSSVHLLLRKKNQGGAEFYKKLGFHHDETYQRADNFVDLDLLTPLTWRVPDAKLEYASPRLC